MNAFTSQFDRQGARTQTPPQLPLGWLGRLHLYRQSLSSMGLCRFIRGGRISDTGRLPRYGVIVSMALVAVWVPITGYLVLAHKQYTSETTLILPGTGVSTSVNLSEIGQASTSANSAYASTSLSPSVTYKNLLESDGVIRAAAERMRLEPNAFGKPVVKLVDETSLIHFAISGSSPILAQQKSLTMQSAFMGQLDKLRDDEIKQRDLSASKTIRDYQDSVDGIRGQISALQLQSGLTSAEQYGGIVASAETLRTQVAETEAAFSERDGSARSLASLLHVSPQIAALTLKVQADEEIGSLNEAASKAAAAAAEMEKQYGPNHPKYLDAHAREMGLRARLAARGAAISGLTPEVLRAAVDASPKGERPALLARLVTTVVERQGLAAQLGARRVELDARKKRIQDLVQIGSKLDALNRDYKIADAVFASALARLNTSKADVFASYPMVQVLEPSSLPKKPSSPSLIIAFGAGIAASFLLGVGLIMTWLRRPIIDRIVTQAKSAENDEEA